MLALTVCAPRAVAIARYGCRVINRSGDLTGWRPGAIVAIHAAHRERAIYSETERVALLARVEFKRIKRQAQAARGRVVALARIRAVTTNQRSIGCDRRWWTGPLGVVLTDVSPLEGMVSIEVGSPVGNVGLWELPAEAVADLERATIEQMAPRREPALVVP